MSTKSSSTKNRRPSANKGNGAKAPGRPAQTRQSAKSGGAKAMAAVLESEQFKNSVVGRRLAFVADDKNRKALAERFVAGESMSKLVEETGITHTRLSYCLRQEAVAQGLVPPVGTSLKELLAAAQEPSFSDAAWVACRSGLTPQKIAKMIAES
jgi:hypothetical protein